jgi:hypothetical protein
MYNIYPYLLKINKEGGMHLFDAEAGASAILKNTYHEYVFPQCQNIVISWEWCFGSLVYMLPLFEIHLMRIF